MKKIVFYFDNSVKKMFVEKVNEEGEKRLTISSVNNFVYTSEVVARVIDVESEDELPSKIEPDAKYYNVADFRTLKAGNGIYFDENAHSYKASEYGFVLFDNATLQLISPLTITRDKLKANYTIYPTKSGKIPKYDDISEALHNARILTRLEQKKIEEQLAGIDSEHPRLARILVGQGREPITGHEEYYIPLLEIKKKAGEILSDGRIDFKETGSIIEVVKGQEILKRVPAIKPTDGFDVFGDRLTGEIKVHEGFYKGVNIVQSGKDENIFVSSIDGCLAINRKEISVEPVVVIPGDVNYDMGNIDFNGSVHVRGSVLTGFTVKATGDINIEKIVEDAHIEAKGDITVKMGIVGKRMVRIIAGGNVTAKYLLNAKVEAAGEIIIEDSIINSDVFSNKKVSVISKHGKIIGGKTTALYDIIVNVAGAIHETETQLSVGRNLFIEKELFSVQKEITKWRDNIAEVMRQLKANFGETVFENPKDFVAQLPSLRKKKCLLLLKELSNSNKELKRNIELAKEIQDRLKLEKEPHVIIKEKAYPGTVINIKKSVRKIDKAMDNVKFYEDSEEKIIRFMPAV